MAEYIERDAAIEVALSCTDSFEPIAVDTTVKSVVSKLRKLPIADVQPVKHGRWIQLTQNVEPTALKCSLCGEISCCYGMYCPDCGARMDGKDNV